MSSVLQLRGLAYASTADDIKQFLGCDGIVNVFTTKTNEGKPSGEAFVVVNSQMAYNQVMSKNKETLGGRYVDIYESNEDVMNKKLEYTKNFEAKWDGVLRLRGLPFSIEENAIKNFFQGMEMSVVKVFMPKMKNGFSTGEAYLQFPRFSMATAALGFHKQQLNGRFIEIYKSSNAEYRRAVISNEKLKHHNQWSKNYVKQQNGQAAPVAESPKKWGGLNIQPKNKGPAQSQNGFSSFGGGPMKSSPMKTMSTNGWGTVTPKAEANVPNTLKGCPVVAVDPKCPYKHIITIKQIPSDTTNTDVQEFFRPAKAVAVNIKPDCTCDVAFKTHDMVVSGLDKNGLMFKGMRMQLICKSIAI